MSEKQPDWRAALETTAAPPASVAQSQRTTVWRRLGGRRSRWLGAAALAAAIALLLWPRPAPLPDYELQVLGAGRATRAADDDPADVPVLIAGRPLSLRLQPQTATTDVTARAYLRRGDELRPLSAATLTVDEAGVLALDGILGADLRLSSGVHRLVLAAARPGALPSRRRLQDRAEGTARGRGWVAVERRIEVREPPSADEARPPAREPWVEYAGCDSVAAGPVCSLPEDGRLTLWVRHAEDEEVRIEADVRRQPARPSAVQGGLRYEIAVGRRTRELVVEVSPRSRDRGGKRSVWLLDVEPAAAKPDWLEQARDTYRTDPEATRRLLEAKLAELEPRELGAAAGLLARIARRQGRPELAEDFYRRAVAAHRQAAQLLAEVDDATSLVWDLIEQKRFADAGEVLDSLPVEALGGSAEARYLEAYYRGLLAEETGDHRAATRWTARAAREAERAGLEKERVYAEDHLARQLHGVGLSDAAGAVQERIRAEIAGLCADDGASSSLDPCDCARFDNNRAWTRLLSLEAGRPAEDPGELLLRAERIFTEAAARPDGGCTFPDDLPDVRLNLALAALHAGDVEAAREHLARALEDPEVQPRLAMWQLDVEARIALAESEATRALGLYQGLAWQAEQGSSPEAAWRAAFGRALALEALGRTGDAVAACPDAEALLDQESLLVPMHGGREKLIAQHEHATRWCLDLHLRAGQEEAALAMVRRSAGRVLRNLRVGARIADLRGGERRLWEASYASYQTTREEIARGWETLRQGLPRDREAALERELEDRRRRLREDLDALFALLGDSAGPSARDAAPPSPGTALLVYHPLPEGWAGFAAVRSDPGDPGQGTGVTVRRLAVPPPDATDDELAARWLAPFAETVAAAEEVQVIAYGPLRDVDFHALPFAGQRLLHHAPVAYRLDLPELAAEPLPASPLALVVADPSLPAAPAEASAVRRALESRPEGWTVEAPAGRPAGLREVRRALSGAVLFHYAGHAELDEASRGWDSHLALGGGRLTVDDVLASSRVPRWVVLSGCDTGSDARTAPLPSIGLAQAFLIAGAEAVVAAVGEVSDEDAAALAEAFYRSWDPTASAAAALRQAQLDLERRDPGSDWRKFRVLVR